MNSIKRFLAAVLTMLAAICALAQPVDHLTISDPAPWGGTNDPFVFVHLTGPAQGLRTVHLASSNPAAASVPSTLEISNSNTNNYFYVHTSAVDHDTAVTITADNGSINFIVKANRPDHLTISQSEAWGGTDTPYIYVHLMTYAQTGGQVVQLSTNHPEIVTLPATMTVAQGNPHNYFYFGTQKTSQPTVVTIYASCNGGTAQIDLLVKANWPSLVTTNAAEVFGGTGVPFSYVHLMGPAGPGGFTVDLSTSDPSALNIPSTIGIGYGYTNNFFYWSSNLVPTDRTVKIIATHLGEIGIGGCSGALQLPRPLVAAELHDRRRKC